MRVGGRVIDEDGREGIVIALSANAEGAVVAHVEYVVGSSEQTSTAWIECDRLIDKD